MKDVRHRIEMAIRNSGFVWPPEAIEFSLDPDLSSADSLDLPLAVGMLAAHGQFRSELLDEYAIVGKLANDGSTREVYQAHKMAMVVALDGSLRGIIVPSSNVKNPLGNEHLSLIPVDSLAQTISFLTGELSCFDLLESVLERAKRLDDARARYIDSLPDPPWRNIDPEDRADEERRQRIFEAGPAQPFPSQDYYDWCKSMYLGGSPQSPEWLERSRKVKERDGNTCTTCPHTDNLEAHHKKFLSQGGNNSMSNLVTLCHTCHEKIHGQKFGRSRRVD